ncbi:putative flagellin (Fla or fliC) [Thiomonas arsenitoxydans]|uniref:Flagellin n=1 Tax=Thiomonas arsenitoxydans (strain DSM 22701 / CIP 110005 / 3As) TaxID=426114 RepID=D6CQD5_THIA3|nr:flagellin [Thiomonas arsenitoxydans]CAZ88215.1 putative flagellin (fla or fliC) [Thiomonas arsenitoxydans]CQR32748.1 putative flagellin (Fla or fliC) [Thiomonas arsenitoxydans]CQR33044.1 putative flagellin (Fla or fliC) [Thiomonas arsenitoxydans]CQR33919.1 putative flagellin (Fla or fliC) [Thiomonas arsenitoxydans]CQR40260.1 putative flagellin (Fla or fliC) [Thiomonas arsenitoxydans]
MAISGIINTNVNALNTLNALGGTSSSLSTYIQQLSTGKQINGPADNPAGYAISQRFQTQINGLNQAVSNGNQAVSLVQTATGALQNETNLLQQIRTIAVQSANGSNTASDRQSLQGVVSQLLAQVSTIATQTQFNGQNILDGSFSGQQFQVGANANQVINVSIANSQGNSIGLNTVGSGGTAKLFDGATNGDLTNNGYGVAYTIGATTGAYLANTNGIAISGSVGSATTAATNPADSASIIASDINKISSQTGVTATASTAAVFKATDGSYTFSLQTSGVGGAGTTVSVTANVANGDLSGLTSAINNTTAQTGISASVDSNGNLKLSQGSGDNISITGFSGTGTLQAVNAKGVALAASNANALLAAAGTPGSATTALIQGAVQVQSTSGFSLDATAAGNIGLAAVSGLTSASNVNVSTVEGANAALAVIDSAINALNQQGGALGAIQNRIQASVQNSQTTATNLQAAQSVVQDANIAQATTQLSKYQILQQAGISTLAQANSLQQSYLKLLP